jgi:hypothetical protein
MQRENRLMLAPVGKLASRSARRAAAMPADELKLDRSFVLGIVVAGEITDGML